MAGKKHQREDDLECWTADLDVRQVHEVLGDVHDKLVHESWCDVVSVHGVVEVVPVTYHHHVQSRLLAVLRTEYVGVLVLLTGGDPG